MIHSGTKNSECIIKQRFAQKLNCMNTELVPLSYESHTSKKKYKLIEGWLTSLRTQTEQQYHEYTKVYLHACHCCHHSITIRAAQQTCILIEPMHQLGRMMKDVIVLPNKRIPNNLSTGSRGRTGFLCCRHLQDI